MKISVLSVFFVFQILTSAHLARMIVIRMLTAPTRWGHSPASVTQVHITTATAKHVIRTVSLVIYLFIIDLYTFSISFHRTSGT